MINMDNELIGICIAFIAVIGGLCIAYYAIYISVTSKNKEKLLLIETRNKERLALIEKGMDPLIADKKNEGSLPYNYLTLGVIMAGFSLGWIIGYILYVTGLVKENLGYITGVLLAGIGLIAFYTYRRRIDTKLNS
jgi:hypothetical protein